MTLSSIVLSRDWQEVSVLECVLNGLRIQVAVEQQPERALERLVKSRIDAVIVDCDLNGSSHVLRHLKAQHDIPVGVMLSAQGARPNDTGATFSFEKPISVEEALQTLMVARGMMVAGRLS